MNETTIQTVTLLPLNQFTEESSTISLYNILHPVDAVTTVQMVIGVCALFINIFILTVMLLQCLKTPLSMTEKLLINQLVLHGLVGLSIVLLRALRYGKVFQNGSLERVLCTVMFHYFNNNLI